MFTGLIKAISTLQSRVVKPGGETIVLVRPPHWKDLELGESITVNGACLTLIRQTENEIDFFVGEETLQKTNFSALSVGDVLNLEQSLRIGDRLGGHLVSGHVDGVATITRTEKRGDCLWFQIKVPTELFKWVMEKGSLSVNGVSLTINHVKREDRLADFFLIPETLSRTNFKTLKANQVVNIECDQVVKVISQQVTRYEVPHEHHP